MKIEDFDNDEPIHHSEGKDLMCSCPSKLTFASSGTPSSPIKQSPHATISPPDIHSHKDRFQKFHKIKELLRGISIFKIHKGTIHQTMVNYNLFIGQMNIDTHNNQTILQDMKNFGPIFNIYNKGTIINNFGNDNQSNEQAEAEEAKDVDHTEVMEVQTEPVGSTKVSKPIKKREKNQLTFIDCIAERETAHILNKWLHQMMDNKDKPKQKLIYLRAALEAGFFSQTPNHDVYVKEFGKMARSSYYDWMQAELKYDIAEINKLIEQYSLFLAQFPK